MGKTSCEIKIYLLKGCRGAPKLSPTTGGKFALCSLVGKVHGLKIFPKQPDLTTTSS